MKTAIKERENVRQTLKEYLATGVESLPLFGALNSDLTKVKAAADQLRRFDKVIFLGTGGSSLGGQALVSFHNGYLYNGFKADAATKENKTPEIQFIDNIDPYTFLKIINNTDIKRTAVVAISKSGNTPETIVQLLTCIDIWHGLSLPDHFLVISEPSDNATGESAMMEIAEKYNIPTLDHPTDVGGRFSIFTVVGMLPALLCGMDVEELRKGALAELSESLMAVKEDKPGNIAEAAYDRYKFYKDHGVNILILFTYVDRLRLLGEWFCQLWAESIGKKNKKGIACGITPTVAFGATDQHSQMQLYVDGPKDKFFTFIAEDDFSAISGNNSKPLSTENLQHKSLKDFHNVDQGKLIKILRDSTIKVITETHETKPQLLIFEKITPYVFGKLVSHFILETLAMAKLLDVNPFDQPGVEQGKIFAKEMLGLIRLK